MIKVSVLELPARWEAATEALDEADALLASAPTDLAIVPEMAIVGYISPSGSTDLAHFAEAIDGETMQAASRIARRHATSFVVPHVLAEGGHVYNASILFGPDGVVRSIYRKRHPWFPERWATPGAEPPAVVEVGGVRVTFAICYDGHFLGSDAASTLRSADLLAFTSAWVDEDATRLPLLETIARDFGVAVANANWGAGVVSVPGQGGSCILDADGRLLAEVSAHGPRRADAWVHPRRPKPTGRTG